ncbi:MAG: hypothetical protein HQL21_04060 [Candidatus Omnitrophica bacterium]|nr:hypothetical protein [Candidatus Omnitrophota bacterium]
MPDFRKYFKIRPYIIIGAFFIGFLVVGLGIFQDYGVHNDEYHNQGFGRRWTTYVANVVSARSLSVPSPKLLPHDYVHGPAFEILLTALQDLFQLKDSRDIILARHLMIFLMFYVGVIFFYLLCWRYFGDWRPAILGCVFLVLYPRIFADAFYNGVDISFLSVFIIGMFTLLVMLDKRTLLSVVIHAFVCAFLINIRLAGLFLPIVTVVFFCLEVWRLHLVEDRLSGLRMLAGYLGSLIILAFLLNPFLWAHPLANFTSLVEQGLNFKAWNSGRARYFGRYFELRELPWHYIWVWIFISIPVTYLALFFTGIVSSVKLFLMKGDHLYVMRRNVAIVLVCFLIPLILITGKAYNGWRHVYFIYPAMVLLLIMGIQHLWKDIRPFLRGVLTVGILVALLDTAFFMIRTHPYQNMYFNSFVVQNTDGIINTFDLDYFGLSYRKALEHILKTDNDAVIPIGATSTFRAGSSRRILVPEDRKRLVVGDKKKAKYFLVTDMVLARTYQDKEYFTINKSVTI